MIELRLSVLVAILVVGSQLSLTRGFQVQTPFAGANGRILNGANKELRRPKPVVVFMSEEEKATSMKVDEGNLESTATTNAKEGVKKISLEEKMASWEASEEEIKAATLGGLVPSAKEKTTGFD